MKAPLTFTAYLPAIKSAILLDGNGDGGQVKLEVPRSDVAALVALQTLAGKQLRVTITAVKASGQKPRVDDDDNLYGLDN